MTQLPWETVAGALVGLGCDVAREGEHRVVLVRGAAVIQALQKLSPVTVRKHEQLLAAFSFSREEYLAAVAAFLARP